MRLYYQPPKDLPPLSFPDPARGFTTIRGPDQGHWEFMKIAYMAGYKYWNNPVTRQREVQLQPDAQGKPEPVPDIRHKKVWAPVPKLEEEIKKKLRPPPRGFKDLTENQQKLMQATRQTLIPYVDKPLPQPKKPGQLPFLHNADIHEISVEALLAFTKSESEESDDFARKEADLRAERKDMLAAHAAQNEALKSMLETHGPEKIAKALAGLNLGK